MAIIAKRIVLDTAPFTIPRMIAGIQINLTDIDRGLYVTRSQMEVILDLTAKVVRHHLDTIYQEITGNKGGGKLCPPLYLTIYEAEVQFASTSGFANRFGGLSEHPCSSGCKGGQTLPPLIFLSQYCILTTFWAYILIVIHSRVL